MNWFSRPTSTGRAPASFAERSFETLELLAVLEEAVVQLDDVERLLERCAVGALRPAEARQSLRLRIAFSRLSRWTEGMLCSPDLLPARERTACLLRFYLLMVTQATSAAYVPATRRQIALRGGNAATAEQLLALRDAVRASSDAPVGGAA